MKVILAVLVILVALSSAQSQPHNSEFDVPEFYVQSQESSSGSLFRYTSVTRVMALVLFLLGFFYLQSTVETASPYLRSVDNVEATPKVVDNVEATPKVVEHPTVTQSVEQGKKPKKTRSASPKRASPKQPVVKAKEHRKKTSLESRSPRLPDITNNPACVPNIDSSMEHVKVSEPCPVGNMVVEQVKCLPAVLEVENKANKPERIHKRESSSTPDQVHNNITMGSASVVYGESTGEITEKTAGGLGGGGGKKNEPREAEDKANDSPVPVVVKKQPKSSSSEWRAKISIFQAKRNSRSVEDIELNLDSFVILKGTRNINPKYTIASAIVAESTTATVPEPLKQISPEAKEFVPDKRISTLSSTAQEFTPTFSTSILNPIQDPIQDSIQNSMQAQTITPNIANNQMMNVMMMPTMHGMMMMMPTMAGPMPMGMMPMNMANMSNMTMPTMATTNTPTASNNNNNNSNNNNVAQTPVQQHQQQHKQGSQNSQPQDLALAATIAAAAASGNSGNKKIFVKKQNETGKDNQNTQKRMFIPAFVSMKPIPVMCKFAARCTRADCQFTHPPHRQVTRMNTMWNVNLENSK